MVRTIPCQHCKRRRRRCERPHEDEPCIRCRKMGKKCIRQDESSEYSSTEDDATVSDDDSDNKTLDSMYQQVEMLENEIGRLEIDINQQQTLMKHKRREPRWELLVNDKEIRLLSKINTLEELMLYSQSFMRYLSPFGSSFQGKSLVFERVHPSIFEVAINLTRQLQSSIVGVRESNSMIASHYLLNNTFDNTIQTEFLVDKFVTNYFTCINRIAPLIHEPTYRLHYKNLKRGPLYDAVTMAICCHTAISVCPHSTYTSHQKRSMAEYFYSKSIDLVLDIYDDPNYTLEALVSLNLLCLFMFSTLRIDSGKRWSTIALSQSAMLKKEIETATQDMYDSNPALRVRHALIKRNCIVAELVHNTIEFTFYKRDLVIQPSFSYFDVLLDEHKETRSFIELVNDIMVLLNHPTTLIIEKQSRQLILGKVAEISFEDILRHEEIMLDWWQNLPSDVKITREPFNCTRDLIFEETNSRKLVMCCFVHSFILNIQTSLIQPKLSHSTRNISSIVRERAIYLTMYSAEIVLASAKRLSTLPNFCLSPIKFLLRSIDSLVSLLKNTDDASIPNNAKERLKECMSELQEAVSVDHQVPSNMSPFQFYSISLDPALTKQLYAKFPNPLEAIMYDITQSMVKSEI
ncbi:hypothetical protein K501DRAFT_236972 [Backusella circina FSU 941]|nr:hypothetical protein K501DRAFT_236972 [Backusella circina FSU 941]